MLVFLCVVLSVCICKHVCLRYSVSVGVCKHVCLFMFVCVSVCVCVCGDLCLYVSVCGSKGMVQDPEDPED